MKVAVIKIGSRISFNAKDTSGGNGEARSIIKMLHRGGAEVHIFTKILDKDNLVPDYFWHDLKNFKGLNMELAGTPIDALIVINGNVNFFGGAEDEEQLHNYGIINNFNGPVFYTYCDPELTLKQVWPSVEKKPWGSKYKEAYLNITRNDIIYLSQPYDMSTVIREVGKGKLEVLPKTVFHFPFERFPCLNPKLNFNPTPEVDLSYGGTMRGGKRVNKMVEFYFGHPESLKVEMFGKLDYADFEKILTEKKMPGFKFLRPPVFTGPVRYDEMLPKMNKAMAHVVIGDPYYEELNDVSQRTYESIWSSVVTFIDKDMDMARRVYGTDRTLADFLYVSNRAELSEKLLLLKSDVKLREQIVEDQFKAIDFNETDFCEGFVNNIDALILGSVI